MDEDEDEHEHDGDEHDTPENVAVSHRFCCVREVAEVVAAVVALNRTWTKRLPSVTSPRAAPHLLGNQSIPTNANEAF